MLLRSKKIFRKHYKKTHLVWSLYYPFGLLNGIFAVHTIVVISEQQRHHIY